MMQFHPIDTDISSPQNNSGTSESFHRTSLEKRRGILRSDNFWKNANLSFSHAL